jgi:hypothetical protein
MRCQEAVNLQVQKECVQTELTADALKLEFPDKKNGSIKPLPLRQTSPAVHKQAIFFFFPVLSTKQRTNRTAKLGVYIT